MADLPSVKDKINDLEVGADKPLSEALQTKYGENINYLIDETDDHETRVTAIEALGVNRNFSNLTNVAGASVSTGNPGAIVAGSSVALTGVLVNSMVEIIVQPQLGQTYTEFFVSSGSGNIFLATLRRNGVRILTEAVKKTVLGSDRPFFSFIDRAPVTGTNTYDIYLGTSGASGWTYTISNMEILAREIQY